MLSGPQKSGLGSGQCGLVGLTVGDGFTGCCTLQDPSVPRHQPGSQIHSHALQSQCPFMQKPGDGSSQCVGFCDLSPKVMLAQIMLIREIT